MSPLQKATCQYHTGNITSLFLELYSEGRT